MVTTFDEITRPSSLHDVPTPQCCCWRGCGLTREPVLVSIVEGGVSSGAAYACEPHAVEMSAWSAAPDWFKEIARELAGREGAWR